MDSINGISYYLHKIAHAIKHITDDVFFFQEDTALVHMHCACNTVQLLQRSRLHSIWVKMWFSCFPVLPGSAEAQVIWGDILKHILIAYFIGNISAKKYQNLFMCVKP